MHVIVQVPYAALLGQGGADRRRRRLTEAAGHPAALLTPGQSGLCAALPTPGQNGHPGVLLTPEQSALFIASAMTYRKHAIVCV